MRAADWVWREIQPAPVGVCGGEAKVRTWPLFAHLMSNAGGWQSSSEIASALGWSSNASDVDAAEAAAGRVRTYVNRIRKDFHRPEIIQSGASGYSIQHDCMIISECPPPRTISDARSVETS